MITGKKDKNGKVIKSGDKINVIGTFHDGEYKVNYGEGSYDSGEYTYLGWFLTDNKGDSDGYGWILTEESSKLEIIT